jgi:hypothetical protein
VANMDIKLTRDEVFKAIQEYAKRNYPISIEKTTINVDRYGAVIGATIKCDLPKNGS